MDPSKLELLKQSVKSYSDFPKKGVLFHDIFSLYQDPKIAKLLYEVITEFVKTIDDKIDIVAGLDARGFLLGPLIALELDVPFIPIRKKGKLPGRTISVDYNLEYNEASLEIQVDLIQKHKSVLIVDDLLATGGSLGAACKLIKQLEANCVGCLVLMELTDLKGRENILTNVYSILKF